MLDLKSLIITSSRDRLLQHFVYGGLLLDLTSLIILSMMMNHPGYMYIGFAYASNICSANGVIVFAPHAFP